MDYKDIFIILITIPVIGGFIIVSWWMFFLLIGMIIETLREWFIRKKK